MLANFMNKMYGATFYTLMHIFVVKCNTCTCIPPTCFVFKNRDVKVKYDFFCILVYYLLQSKLLKLGIEISGCE